MKRLKDVKVGDTVFITDINHKRGAPTPHTVTKVGRKYVTAGRDEFELATGQWNSKDYGSHRHAFTPDEWERQELESRYRQSAKAFADAIQWGRSLAHLTDSDLTVGTETFQTMLEKLTTQKT